MPDSVGLAALPLIDEGFAHTIAHDLRSPLTAIQMCAESLSVSDDTSLRHRYAALIAEQAQSIAWALENLVTLADAQGENADPSAAVDLGDVARVCLDELSGLAATRQIALAQHLPAGVPAVYGAESGLHQAVRACAHATLSALPSGSELLASLSGPAFGHAADEVVTLSLVGRASVEGVAGGLEAVDLPWYRLPLLTAAHLVAAHGGTVSEPDERGALGVIIELPAADGGEGPGQ